MAYKVEDIESKTKDINKIVTWLAEKSDPNFDVNRL